MSSVTNRINEIKQAYGGYIKPSDFDVIKFNDGISMNESENVHSACVGMAVDYLTRFLMGAKLKDAFKISIYGAIYAEELGKKGSIDVIKSLLREIKGLDDDSIKNALKAVTFDVWYRNTPIAFSAKDYKDTNPDKETIENVQTLVKRSLKFFEKYGPIVKDGFTFEPSHWDESQPKIYPFGGYTTIVDSGDGDFLTADTLWDFKVSKSKPTSKHTLQLLMYWIMGQHSGQDIYKKITKLGIFNPRLNAVFLYDISKVSDETIKVVEKDVICY